MGIIDEYDMYDKHDPKQAFSKDSKLEEDIVTTFLMGDLYFQKLNLDNAVNKVKSQFLDLFKRLNYPSGIDLNKSEITKEIVLVDYQDKISLLRRLSWETLKELTLDVEWEKIKCFDIYLDAVDKYIETEDVVPGSEEEIEAEDDEDEDSNESQDILPEHIIYIIPSYQIVNDGIIDYDPKNMEYETYVHEIKELIIGNKKYRFL